MTQEQKWYGVQAVILPAAWLLLWAQAGGIHAWWLRLFTIWVGSILGIFAIINANLFFMYKHDHPED